MTYATEDEKDEGSDKLCYDYWKRDGQFLTTRTIILKVISRMYTSQRRLYQFMAFSPSIL